MSRLTRKLENSRYAQNYTTGDGFFVGMTEMMQKLGRLEDLQEAGRLVALPETLDKDSLLCIIAETTCPHCVGLSDWIGTERCYEFDNCQACWIEALKGGE